MLFEAPEWQTVAQRLDVTWAAAGLASANDDVGRMAGDSLLDELHSKLSLTGQIICRRFAFKTRLVSALPGAPRPQHVSECPPVRQDGYI